MASATLRLSIPLQCPSSNKEPTLVSNSRSILTNYCLPRQPPSRFTGVAFSTRRRYSATPSVTSKKINKKKNNPKKVGEDEDIDEDAFEALFRQLEEDLKNDELNGDDGGDDDDVSEEELAKLEQELAEALGDDELLGALEIASREETGSEVEDEDEDDDDDDDDDDDVDDVIDDDDDDDVVDDDDDDDVVDDDDDDDDVVVVDDDDDDDDEEEEEEEEEETPNLKNWQLRRLAYALKNGRRKTRIKNLAADLCLDRAVVLKLLRDPPPNLVMLSATLPDKPASTISNPVEAFPLETHTAKPEEVKKKLPVHVMQSNWSDRKRLKKVQVQTLEQVYKRTKRPTNAMISSIVHVTNLPRKKVVKWFEDKRVEEGVPEHRLPYQRSASESVFTS